jgi:hypothetical protein
MTHSKTPSAATSAALRASSRNSSSSRWVSSSAWARRAILRFQVVGVEPARSLVLMGVDPATHELPPTPVTSDTTAATTWSWQLKPRGDEGTRLVTRQRLTFPRTQSVLWHVVEPINFVMERRMLVGIKRRTERRWRSSRNGRPVGSCALGGRWRPGDEPGGHIVG